MELAGIVSKHEGQEIRCKAATRNSPEPFSLSSLFLQVLLMQQKCIVSNLLLQQRKLLLWIMMLRRDLLLQ
jgi:hypothetical protein